MDAKTHGDIERMDPTLEEMLQSLLKQDGGEEALIKSIRAAGYIVHRERFPEQELRRPLLETLYEMGGSGEVREVLIRVERKVRFRLSRWDYTVISSSGRVRWEDYTRWARQRLKEEGLISNHSPHGVWELTRKGKEEVEITSAESLRQNS